MPDGGDYHAFNSTKGGSGGGSGGGGLNFLCWIVIIIVVILFFSLLADGADWDAFDSLLGLGFLAFLFAKSLG